MIILSFGTFFAVLLAAYAVPTPSNSKDGGSVGELPENWDQTKDDTQSLFLNKSDKNDLEPYPLALSEEGNSEGYDTAVDQRGYESQQATGELDNLIMRPELYGEPPAMEGLGQGYDSKRRKRGSSKVGGAGAATKVATKAGSGKKNLKPALEPMRRKRDSGLSAADVRALLTLWEAQERRKAEWNPEQWAAERYYGRVNPAEDDQGGVDENGEIWYNEPVVVGPHERESYPHHSYFSEQNRLAMAHGYPDMYQVDPELAAQRYEEVRRKRQYANKVKRFMVARKRSEGMHQNTNYRPRDDLYTLAELLRSSPRAQEQDMPVYRRLIL